MTNNKFVKRFDLMMQLCQEEAKQMNEYSPAELEQKWQDAKQIILKSSIT